MAKPIFVTYAPVGTTREVLGSTLDAIDRKLKNDYHCFVVEGKESHASFQMFNGENLDDITIEELKQLIKLPCSTL